MMKTDNEEYNKISDSSEKIENQFINKMNYENKLLIDSLKNGMGEQMKKDLDEQFLKPIKKTKWQRFKEWWRNFRTRNTITDEEEYWE